MSGSTKILSLCIAQQTQQKPHGRPPTGFSAKLFYVSLLFFAPRNTPFFVSRSPPAESFTFFQTRPAKQSFRRN
jgi:hypothetical protein